MLKRPIKYENLDGEEVTEVFYFHLSQAEIIEMEVAHEGGLAATLQRMVETKDRKGLIAEFKKLILATYGVRSDDGKRFIKTPELAQEFTQTPAYSALFMELATDDKAASDFVVGVMPTSMQVRLDQDKPQLPPPPPATIA